MPKTIWKAEIQPNAVADGALKIHIPAPAGSRAVSAGLQAGKVCVWFEADPTAPPDHFLPVWCVGTGCGRVPEDLRFLATVQQGPYVWHLYCE